MIQEIRFLILKINIFRGDLYGISAKKEALVAGGTGSVVGERAFVRCVSALPSQGDIDFSLEFKYWLDTLILSMLYFWGDVTDV